MKLAIRNLPTNEINENIEKVHVIVDKRTALQEQYCH